MAQFAVGRRGLYPVEEGDEEAEVLDGFGARDGEGLGAVWVLGLFDEFGAQGAAGGDGEGEHLGWVSWG